MENWENTAESDKAGRLLAFGGGMSAALFLTSVFAVLVGQSVGTGAKVPLFYEPLYYAKLLIALVNASAIMRH